MNEYIFISHSSRDKQQVLELVEFLESSGIGCWTSYRDIPVGSDWAESIYDAIAASSGMLLVFTGNANVSRQVRNELDIATNLGKPIMPLKTEATEASKGIRYFTNSHQWLDASGGWQDVSDRIIEGIRNIGREDHPEDFVSAGKRRTAVRFAILSLLALAAVMTVQFVLGGFGKPRHEAADTDLLNIIAGGRDTWDYATDIIRSHDGRFVVTGTWDWGFWSEWWTTCFDSTGGIQWSISDSLSGECRPSLILLDGGDCIAAASEYADMEHTGYYVRAFRTSSEGGEVWSRKWWIDWPGAIQTELASMNRDEDGKIRLAFTMRSLDNRPFEAIHIISFDENGERMQLDTIPLKKEAFAFLPDMANGDYLLYRDIDSRGIGIDHICSDGYSISAVIGSRLSSYGCGAVTADNGILILLFDDINGAGNGDLHLMKYNEDLGLSWERTIAGELSDVASDIQLFDDGSFMISGYTRSYGDGSADGWVLLLEEGGRLIWQRIIDCGGNDRIIALSSEDSRDRLLLAGYTTKFGDPDAWILEISMDGSCNETPVLGIDLLREDWESGYLDQAVWLMGRNRNYASMLLEDSTSGNTALDANGVPLVSRESFLFEPGLSLSASIFVEDKPDAFGSNWASIGFTKCGAEDFHLDPSAAREREFRWVYTEGINGQSREITASVNADSTLVWSGGDSLITERSVPQRFTIENYADKVVFIFNDSLVAELSVPEWVPGDSIRIFLFGNSGSLAHRIDDVRLYRRMW
ncbi:MAG: toll/interleukin-1 receptor domain-containing protein [Candidatus Fermentibacteraceae bacterium]|nr:toll/interleukin-1 receptor domain-containing protein [Candidatus Fermentibacteraceae bacterium]